MSRIIGRRMTVAIGREETTYGTKSGQIVDFPIMEMTLDLTQDILLNDQAFGLIDDNCLGSTIGKKAASFSIKGVVSDAFFGQILKGTFGTLTTTVDSPVAGANSHAFTLLQSNDHPSYSFIYKDVNDVKAILGALCGRLEVGIVAGEWVSYTANFTGRFPVDTTETITPVKEEYFTAAQSVCKIASAVAGLAAAAAVPLETGTLVLEKNLESHFVWGSTDIEQVTNKQFSVSGTFELLNESDTIFDNFNDHDIQAMSITLTSDVMITGTTPFSLAFTIPAFHIANWSSPKTNDDLVKQTFEIKAEYDTVTSKTIDAVLINDTATAVY